MNVATFHQCVRNDYHCPTCRVWYLKVSKDTDKLQLNTVEWIDEWVRRRNGDKYQTINIIPDVDYNLSAWSLNTNSNMDVNATYLLLWININKKGYCPDNIIFHVNFYESESKAYEEAKNLSGTNLECFTDGYFKQSKSNESKGKFFIVLKLEENTKICLNNYCPQIQENKWNDKHF